jgi:F0F1-type ATP synthase membrane subunit b/b'
MENIIQQFYNSQFIQSNTFNFVLVVLLLIYVCKSLKISDKLTSAQNKVKETIDNSQKTKEDSIQELLNASAQIENIKEEISNIANAADENIKHLQEKIERETTSQLENIKDSTTRIIETENKQTISTLTNKTAIAALEVAKEHIKRIIKAKPHYHQKFIEESIQELESGLK